MRPVEPPFKLEDQNLKIAVSEHSIGDSRVFHLAFSDQRKPLNITVSEKRPTGEKFWTSIPQGRQDEAEQFGKLIANFIRSKKKG